MNDSRFSYFNPNPKGSRVGDCTIRAISKATGKDWELIYAGLSAYGYMLCDMPSANHVWGAYLKREGFKRHLVDDHGQDVYTVEDFCVDHPEGVYILAIEGHVVCVDSGRYYDSWDSGNEIPVFYWARGDAE